MECVHVFGEGYVPLCSTQSFSFAKNMFKLRVGCKGWCNGKGKCMDVFGGYCTKQREVGWGCFFFFWGGG